VNQEHLHLNAGFDVRGAKIKFTVIEKLKLNNKKTWQSQVLV